jgi:hypothetical protein
VEVDQEPTLNVGESQIPQKLAVMNRRKLLNRFYLHYYFAVDDQVRERALTQALTVVGERAYRNAVGEIKKREPCFLLGVLGGLGGSLKPDRTFLGLKSDLIHTKVRRAFFTKP